jgi:DNA-directed RNA polymerase specialized sigma24 family protein
MSESPARFVARHVHDLIDRQRLDALPDHALLGRFLDGDEPAFAALVRRHGPLVLGTCRRVLRHTQDAEDACQAVFLVLARKAATVRGGDSLAGWLHRVALRAASRLRRLRRTAESFERHGLRLVEDLGARFEATTGTPVPLGGVFVRRDVAARTAKDVEKWVGESLAYARANPTASRAFVRKHAQEADDGVTAAHIGLYVNEFSAGYGDEGEDAIARLLLLAEKAGRAPASKLPTFVG